MMPTFDIVSKIEQHELTNAVDQANREVSTRFDFKGTNAKYVLNDTMVVMTAPSDFQLKQMFDILQGKVAKRSIDVRVLDPKEVHAALHEAKQEVHIKQGIDKVLAKEVVGLIKQAKLKVQASIQGEQVRVTGKKRDDLQDAISMLREAKLAVPLQFENFRD
jgi:cyclic-di-GMP-binding protein